ncbi:aminotransferase [Campylobacter avium LMG 24591]|uniref:Aminotransferase n=1 Tax=Campylobacter avium LMG 24591 TaxID=522484 RepID=A0A222MV91_9BACT|nr:histidinol-phosphate transaminase [Campylobacter avium]ASQ29974.1 aminotransferase [Campylobacter avium LMG 24591]OYD79073.1 aminotransferase [Campylobacter avium]
MRANKNIQLLKPYVSIPHKVWNLEDTENALKLDWNEATVPPSALVFEKVNEFLQNSQVNWYPNTKNTKLLKALAAYTKQSDDCVEIFAGSDAAHELIIDVFLDKDEIIGIVAPTYDNFRARANGVGIKTLNFLLDENFNIDFSALSEFILKHKIKLLYICNPNNPTGVLYDKEKLKNLILSHMDTMFLVDEAYYEFANESLCELCKSCKNLIITRTFSKAFALASFRIGYIVSHSENIEYINKLRNPKSVSALSQVAALAALKDLDYMRAYVIEVSCARDEFLNFIFSRSKQEGLYKSYANFVLIRAENIAELVKFLQDSHIYIRDYTHIIQNAARVSIGTREQMQKLILEIEDFIRLNGASSEIFYL